MITKYSVSLLISLVCLIFTSVVGEGDSDEFDIKASDKVFNPSDLKKVTYILLCERESEWKKTSDGREDVSYYYPAGGLFKLTGKDPQIKA